MATHQFLMHSTETKRSARVAPRREHDPTSGEAPPKRILLVEDEIWIALDLERILIAAGYDVVRLAKEEMEALRLADATRPSLVLMDVRLRDGSDGIDAAKKIYEKFGIRSIFLSAHLDEGTRRRAAAARPFAFIEKPFELPALLKEISAALPGG